MGDPGGDGAAAGDDSARGRDARGQDGGGDRLGISRQHVRLLVAEYLLVLPSSFLSELADYIESRRVVVDRIARILDERVALTRDQASQAAAWIEQEVGAIAERHRAEMHATTASTEAEGLAARRGQATQVEE